MTAATLSTKTKPKTPPPTWPQPMKWTVKPFHDLSERKLWGEGKRVMLIDGQLLDRHNPAGVVPLAWTCEQFHSASDLGAFEGRNVILVDGEVLEMPAPNPPHNSGVELLADALRAAFGPGHWVRVQMGLDLSLSTDPVPDVAVIVGTPRTVTTQPTTALLIVEVSDSTFATDSGPKASLYAAAAIREYWVLDVNGRQLIVHRDPVADAAAPFGFQYATVTALGPADRASPLTLPGAGVLVSEMLP